MPQAIPKGIASAPPTGPHPVAAVDIMPPTATSQGTDRSICVIDHEREAKLVDDMVSLIFKRISVRGFFLSDPEHAAKIVPLVVEAAELLRSGRLHAPVAATYPLSAIKDAVAHVQRGGKVLLDVAAS